MNNGNAAVLCAAGMDEIPSLYENLRQQFPPEELYPEEILRSLIRDAIRFFFINVHRITR